MKAFYILMKDITPIMVIPDVNAHVDGHPILTSSYALYKSDGSQDRIDTLNTDKLLAPEKLKHPDYLGTIFYDEPDHSISYDADGLNELSAYEVEDIIKQINSYRKNSGIWQI